MNTIDDYLDAARQLQHQASDRSLSVFLGLGPTAVSLYRIRKAWPSEETMVRLADLAGMDAQTALAELGFWRAAARQEHRAAETYRRMVERIASTAAALLICLMVLPGSGNAARTNPVNAEPLYIMGNYWII